MVNESLATYLNDHLAGSVVALELLDHLAEQNDSTRTMLTTLHSDITADRETLERLMAQLDITTSRPRQAAAWLVEKLSELKLRLDNLSGSALRQLEGLEAVAMGIDGKIALWHALAAVRDDVPELKRLDYLELLRRAEAQRQVVEELRLRAAKEAFTGTA
ncbi:MAG: hypothetical protein H0T18_06585 [Chloroflexia bacterium]|nr:hypothetical protein [Chloroflexia bacterium]